MIDLQKVRDALEAAMTTADETVKGEFIVEYVPDMLNELEQLRNEKNLTEIALAEAEDRIKELES